MRSRLFDGQDIKSISLEEYRQIVDETKEDLKEGEKIANETKYAYEQLKHFTELFSISPKTNYGMKALLLRFNITYTKATTGWGVPSSSSDVTLLHFRHKFF